MKNPPGLVHISTGGSASTTSVTIDGNPVMAARAVIVIDPNNGENHIKLSCFSRQKNGTYEDGEVQTFYGISKENFEFIKPLMHYLSQIDDSQLDRELSMWEIPTVQAFWAFVKNARKEKTDEQA